MLKNYGNTLNYKIAVVESVVDALAPALQIDYVHEDAVNGISEAWELVRQYPDFEDIERYPLGRILADKKVINIEENLRLCLSGNAPNGTIEIVLMQLRDALTNLQSFIN